MGQAKQNRTRLGSWYGKPVVEGHPDFVVKVKKPAAQPVPIPIDRAVEENIEVSGMQVAGIDIQPNTSYVLTNQKNPSENGIYRSDKQGTLHRTDDPLPDSYVPERRPHRPRSSFKTMAILSMALGLIGSVDLGPPVQHRPNKR